MCWAADTGTAEDYAGSGAGCGRSVNAADEQQLAVNGGAVMQMFRPAGHFNRMLSMFPRVVRMITPIPGNL